MEASSPGKGQGPAGVPHSGQRKNAFLAFLKLRKQTLNRIARIDLFKKMVLGNRCFKDAGMLGETVLLCLETDRVLCPSSRESLSPQWLSSPCLACSETQPRARPPGSSPGGGTGDAHPSLTPSGRAASFKPTPRYQTQASGKGEEHPKGSVREAVSCHKWLVSKQA